MLISMMLFAVVLNVLLCRATRTVSHGMLFFVVLSMFFIQAPEENFSPASSASLSFSVQNQRPADESAH